LWGQYAFITDEDGCNICKYELDQELVEALKKIHFQP